MPWNARTALEQRRAFIEEWQREQDGLAELCRKYGISRPTGYKWVQRFEAQGVAGLEELSRAPHNSPQAISGELADQVIALRQQHPRWGPRKLRVYLEKHHPSSRWPANSSIGELLQREGLVQGRRLRRRTPRYSEPLAHAAGPNQVWCADFKGWFHCGNGERCDPLTIATRTAGICCAAEPWKRQTGYTCGESSRRYFGNVDCRRRSARTTGRRLWGQRPPG